VPVRSTLNIVASDINNIEFIEPLIEYTFQVSVKIIDTLFTSE